MVEDEAWLVIAQPCFRPVRTIISDQHPSRSLLFVYTAKLSTCLDHYLFAFYLRTLRDVLSSNNEIGLCLSYSQSVVAVINNAFAVVPSALHCIVISRALILRLGVCTILVATSDLFAVSIYVAIVYPKQLSSTY